MAYEFQKLADVEAVEEFPEEGASVLIEHEGGIKKCPADGIGGGAGGAPVLLISQDQETEEIIFELEDGRSATEFAKSFESTGIITQLIALQSGDLEGSEIGSLLQFYTMEKMPEDAEEMAGYVSYLYILGGSSAIYLTNLDFESLEVMDHFVWKIGDF